MTKLEIAQQKLERLEKERDEAIEATYEHGRLTNGQPMNDKRNGASWLSKRDKLEERIFKKMDEIKVQTERIEYLKEQQFKKECHLTANYGLKTCVQNIDELKTRKQNKATREKIKLLEDIITKAKKDKEIMTEKTRKIIEHGKVKQWEDKPIYYFICGLKKVAFVIDKNGDFALSKKYPCKNKSDEDFIKKLLKVMEVENENRT